MATEMTTTTTIKLLEKAIEDLTSQNKRLEGMPEKEELITRNEGLILDYTYRIKQIKEHG